MSVWGTVTYLLEAAERYGQVNLARFFLCYPYLSWSPRTIERVLSALSATAKTVRLGLDSGGFVGRVKLPRDQRATIYNYAAFLRDYGELFDLVLNWDYGLPSDNYKAFKMLASQGLKITPVWRLGDPPSYLSAYVEETPSRWVAIGGFGMLSRHNARMRPLFNKLIALVEAIKTNHPDVKFHALGCGFNTTLLSCWIPDSADSTTPLQAQRYRLLICVRNGAPARVAYPNLTQNDLPPNITLKEFFNNPRARTIVHAYWALRVTEFLNKHGLRSVLQFAVDDFNAVGGASSSQGETDK